jgi:hypothetical protein
MTRLLHKRTAPVEQKQWLSGMPLTAVERYPQLNTSLDISSVHLIFWHRNFL